MSARFAAKLVDDMKASGDARKRSGSIVDYRCSSISIRLRSMSRDSAPVEGIGRLSIDAATDMPVMTRSAGVRSRDPVVRQASSGATSRPGGAARRLRGDSARRSSTRRTTRQSAIQEDEEEEDVDEDNDNEDENDNESDSDSDDTPFTTRALRTVTEILSLYTLAYLTPAEFLALRPESSPSQEDPITESDRRLRHLANETVAVLTPQALARYRAVAPRDYCLERTTERMEERFQAIRRDLAYNLQNGTGGLDVPQAIDAFRNLFLAIGGLFHQDAVELNTAQQNRLVAVLFSVLALIRQDTDLYTTSTDRRPHYASESSSGVPYRRFMSAQGNPVAFVQVLRRVPVALLREPSERPRQLLELATYMQREHAQAPAYADLRALYLLINDGHL